MGINTHLFHNVIDVMFPFITMLGGMIESSTQTTWWAMFQLLVMCVVLILIGASVILEILPDMGSSSEMLRT